MSEAEPTRRGLVVAIDGPAGAGKSTVAAFLARRFHLLNLETGAMYRALAWKALVEGVNPCLEPALLQLVTGLDLRLEATDGPNRVVLNGSDITAKLREPAVTAAASEVSVHPAVRAWMVHQQRLLGARGGVVMEGRDIGTVVFPDADLKIFLDASPAVRGVRRYQQQGPDTNTTATEVTRDMEERDRRDRSRADSPLRPAADAVRLDSSQMTLHEMLEVTSKLVEERLHTHI